MTTKNKSFRGVNFHDDILILEGEQLNKIRKIACEMPNESGRRLMDVVADIEAINQDESHCDGVGGNK